MRGTISSLGTDARRARVRQVLLVSAEAHSHRRLMASATAGSTSSATSGGGADSSVQASAVAVSKGGSSLAASSASTEALKQAEDTFAEAVLRVIPQTRGNKSCEDVIKVVSLEVEAIGLAFASVYADAFGQVRRAPDVSHCRVVMDGFPPDVEAVPGNDASFVASGRSSHACMRVPAEYLWELAQASSRKPFESTG